MTTRKNPETIFKIWALRGLGLLSFRHLSVLLLIQLMFFACQRQEESISFSSNQYGIVSSTTSDYQMIMQEDEMHFALPNGAETGMRFNQNFSSNKETNKEDHILLTSKEGDYDLKLYSKDQTNMAYDLIVKPGFDPGQIKINLERAENPHINGHGDLFFTLGEDWVKHTRPVTYQIIDGERVNVESNYVLNGAELSFQIGDYDSSQDLIIDPELMFFLGGGGVEPTAGSASVDGDPSEWNLTDDLYAIMRKASKVDKEELSRAYLRYDCNNERLYLLVLITGTAEYGLNQGWMKITDIQGGDLFNSDMMGSFPNAQFSWIINNALPAGMDKIGYEASFPVAPGDYCGVRIHLNVFQDGGSQTSGTTSENTTLDLDFDCPSCPTLTDPLTITSSPICEGETFTVTVQHSADLGDIELLYGDPGKDVDEIYAGTGLSLLATLTPVSMLTTSTTSGNLSIASTGTKTIYARLRQTPTVNPNYMDGTCKPTADGTITINANPTMQDLTLCVGETEMLTFTGTPGSFSSNADGIATVDNSGNVNGVSAGTATITFTDNNSCQVTAMVTVKALPTVNDVTLELCDDGDGSVPFDLNDALDSGAPSNASGKDVDNGTANTVTFHTASPATAANQIPSELIISGIIDGNLPGGVPKAIELFATCDIPDLTIYGIGSANNGGGSDGEELSLSGSANAGDYIYITSDAADFNSYFGFNADYTSSVASVNGDDAIELFKNSTVIDIYGEVSHGGSIIWDYANKWVYRNANTGPDGSTFVSGNWTLSAGILSDDVSTNAEANYPMPVGTYKVADAIIMPVTELPL